MLHSGRYFPSFGNFDRKLFRGVNIFCVYSFKRTNNSFFLFLSFQEKGLDTVPVGSSSSIGRFSVGGLQNAGAGAGASEYSDLQVSTLCCWKISFSQLFTTATRNFTKKIAIARNLLRMRLQEMST